MREPERVAECMAAAIASVRIPATVKCRIGVDDQLPEESLFSLVDQCAQAGVTTFIVHARKAWLEGLSPKENRDIPPLDYGLVHRLKAERPGLTIVINGGLKSLEEARAHVEQGLDGAMLGRAAYHEPAILGEADRMLFDPEAQVVTPEEAVLAYRPYLASELARGTHLYAMARHMLGLFHGRPGARAWRRILTVEGVKAGAGLEVVDRALDTVTQEAHRREQLGREQAGREPATAP
jgi:tRNA-dihydrouridine synthase A